MTDFHNGDSYDDFIVKTRRPKRPSSGFCLQCGVELSENEFTYCHMCEHVYQEWQESLMNEDE